MNFIIGSEAEELLKTAEANNAIVARHKRKSKVHDDVVLNYLSTSMTKAFTVRVDPNYAKPFVTGVHGTEEEMIQYFNEQGGEWLSGMIIDLSDDEMAALTKVVNLLTSDQDFDDGMTAEIADALIAFDIESKTPAGLADILSQDERSSLFFRELVTQAIYAEFVNRN